MTDRIKDSQSVGAFSLLGGPLYRLGCWSGLVRGGTNTLPLGVVLGASLWLVLVLLALVEGQLHRVFTFEVIAGHVRLLLVIPLFFFCEREFGARAATLVSTLMRSGVVAPGGIPALELETARTTRWKDAWLPEVLCFVAAVLVSPLGFQLGLSGGTATWDPRGAPGGVTLMALWYWGVCLTLFRFLILRWLWRLGLWLFFLCRVSRLELHLVPTHPDGAAGLGYLEVVQIHLAPLVMSISAVEAASFAEEIQRGTMTLEAVYPLFATILAIDVLLFVGPLFLFAPMLWNCKVKGLSDYMEFASDYVGRFDDKWLKANPPPSEPLLGTSDIQSLADMANSVNLVRNMRWVPVSLELAKSYAAAALVPFLPLLLLKYPIAELAKTLIQKAIGL
jgi:hypothetical protein